MSPWFAIILPLFALHPAPVSWQQNASFAPSSLDDSSGSQPYAIDRFEGQPELVRVHESPVVYKANTRTLGIGEVAGAHALTVLHDSMPTFYIHHADTADKARPSFIIVRAFAAKDLRVFAQAQPADRPTRSHIVGLVASTTETLAGGWSKITPRTPLAPGEYALNPVPASQNAYSSIAFDFSIDPAAPNSPDVVAAPDPSQGTR